MKAFGFALLFVVAAVQARSAGVQISSGTPALAGENPWVVHLRIATSTGAGLLSTCVGSLIDDSWILTAASCLEDGTFIWIRYGALDVIRPELVTESNRITISEDGVIGLIDINRIIETTDNIAPIILADADAELPASGKLCGFGADGQVPGEQLSCIDVSLESGDNSIIGSSDEQPTQFDIGAPLVADGVQVGVLTGVEGDNSVYANVADYLEWIESVKNAEL